MNTLRRAGPLLGIAIMAAAGCSHGSSSVVGITTIRGSGNVAEVHRTVSGFSAVAFATLGSLEIVQGAQEALHIRAEDNLLPYLTTEVHAGELAMRTATGVDLQETRPIEFFLTVVDLDRLDHSGVGGVRISDLDTDHLALSSSGIGAIRCLGLDAIDIDVTASGIGTVTVSGAVDAQVVTVQTFGEYDARDLASREAAVTIRGQGSATVRVSDRLDVTMLGAGTVFYIGDPIVTVRGSGSGRVEKIG